MAARLWEGGGAELLGAWRAVEHVPPREGRCCAGWRIGCEVRGRAEGAQMAGKAGRTLGAWGEWGLGSDGGTWRQRGTAAYTWD